MFKCMTMINHIFFNILFKRYQDAVPDNTLESTGFSTI